jgi:hypothetical protein
MFVVGETEILSLQDVNSNLQERLNMQKLTIILMFCISFVACTPIEIPITEVVIFPVVLRAEAVRGDVGNKAGGYTLVTGYSNEKTKISVTIADLAPKSVHAGQIRYGECDDKSTKTFLPLSTLQANEYGDGFAETSIPTKKFDANKAKKEPLIVLYFQRGETDLKGIGDPIVCGDLKYR